MANDKRSYPKFTTPRITFKFPKLTNPDYGSKDYPKPDGEYSLKGILKAGSPEATQLIAKLQPLYDEAMKDAEAKFKELKVETRKKLGSVKPNDLFTTIYDQETEEPTGEIEFKFAMKASGTYKKGPKEGKKWFRKPDLYDAKGLPMRKAPDIWGGTVGKVSFEASPYFIPGTGAAGLKLALLGAQIIELVSGGSKTAASHGFGEEEGYGYEEPADEGTSEDSGFPDQTGNDSAGDEDF
jgi:hypothetical protein